MNSEKEGIVRQLEKAVSMVEEYAKIILTEDNGDISKGLLEFTGLLNVIFPVIIQDYTFPEFANRQEEINVWVQLLGQITDTLAGKDTLAKTDILYAVLRPDLMEHIQVLKESM